MALAIWACGSTDPPGTAPLVFQSDFGRRDGEVAVMHGVAYRVSRDLDIFDITHDIEPFNIWEGAYKLKATAPYWVEGTVFVSVVDPGVGTDRRSVVLKTKSGHYFVSPDNGSLTLVAQELGIEALREIDETVNRRKGTEESHTFHGRDVYAYTGARLAAGVIAFEEVGPLLEPQVKELERPGVELREGIIYGFIPYIDRRFNVWTNIDLDTFKKLRLERHDLVRITIKHGSRIVYQADVPYVDTFGQVPVGGPLVFINSRFDVSLALNQEDFAKTFRIRVGPDWTVGIATK
ncbi:MAG: S-adenosyl-l-methionine hydroxide adenosyltransferase family protein [Acidobacteriota bacterium]